MIWETLGFWESRTRVGVTVYMHVLYRTRCLWNALHTLLFHNWTFVFLNYHIFVMRKLKSVKSWCLWAYGFYWGWVLHVMIQKGSVLWDHWYFVQAVCAPSSLSFNTTFKQPLLPSVGYRSILWYVKTFFSAYENQNKTPKKSWHCFKSILSKYSALSTR